VLAVIVSLVGWWIIVSSTSIAASNSLTTNPSINIAEMRATKADEFLEWQFLEVLAASLFHLHHQAHHHLHHRCCWPHSVTMPSLWSLSHRPPTTSPLPPTDFSVLASLACVFVAFRLINGISVSTAFDPDEFWQGAHPHTTTDRDRNGCMLSIDTYYLQEVRSATRSCLVTVIAHGSGWARHLFVASCIRPC
jgi:hypothetical protein